MIPAPFAYAKPDTIEEAIELLQSKDAHVLAGGHSILTALKHRLKSVDLLVDIANLDLAEIALSPVQLRIGAMARQSEVMQACRNTSYDLLAKVGDASGDPAIRARGTVLGAICAVEPGGDWAAAALAMDAKIHLHNGKGKHTVPVADLIAAGGPPLGTLSTYMVAPTPPEGAQSHYIKVKHAAIGWSIASAAIILADNHARIAISGAVPKPVRLKHLENAWLCGDKHLSQAIEDDFADLAFIGDSYASPQYRRERLKVLLKRALSNGHAS